jgi:integrase
MRYAPSVTRSDLTEEQRRGLAGQFAWARPVTDAAGEDLRTPDELLDAMLRNFAVVSRDPYRSTVQEFFWYMRNFQPQTPVLETHPGQITEWEAFLKSPGPIGPENGDATVRTKRAQVSAFFRYCMGQRRVPSNPVVRLPGSRGRRRFIAQTEPILLPEQIEAMLDTARRDGYRSWVVVGILIGMGLRVTELRDAKLENLRERGGAWTLTISRKNDTEEDGKKIEAEMQTLDVPTPLVPILAPYTTDRPATGPLIPGGYSSRPNFQVPLSGDAIASTVERLAKRAGIEFHVFPHLLRHTSITLALTDKPYADEERVAAYYGHSDKSTLRVYNHHPYLPNAGYHRNPVGLDWRTQKGTNRTLAA